jgi:predicted hydrocarbon binding protein
MSIEKQDEHRPASAEGAELNRLNAIGVLTRREIEAQIVAPLLEAMGREFGRERVVEIAREVIIRIAREQGAQLAEGVQGRTLAHFAETLEHWKKDDALRIEVVEQTEDKFSFDVTNCRYAEMYKSLGIPELGALLSCNRDFALIQGFNPGVALTRTQTIMEGAPFCNFRYTLKRATEPAAGGQEDSAPLSTSTPPAQPSLQG